MLDLFVSPLATLFVIIDPIGLTPLFVALTAGMATRQRRVIALRGVAIAAVVLTLFGLVGEQILAAIGIGLPAFRISGGVMLFLIALEMLFEKRQARREKAAGDGVSTAPVSDPSVFPIGTPLLAGPGAMATMILLIGDRTGDLEGQIAVFAALYVMLALCLAAFFAAGALERLLGQTGVNVVTRLLGVLLGALAVQFVLDGLRDFGLAPGAY